MKCQFEAAIKEMKEVLTKQLVSREIKKDDSEIIKNYLLLSEPNCSIASIMTEKTKVFLGERESIFKNVVSEYETL